MYLINCNKYIILSCTTFVRMAARIKSRASDPRVLGSNIDGVVKSDQLSQTGHFISYYF